MSNVGRLASLVLLGGLGLSAFSQAPQSTQGAQTDKVTLRIIVVGSADQARRVVEQLTRGDNFVALAKKVSIDTTADNGGMLGSVQLSALRPELRTALEHVAVGQLSEVVRIPTGFAVLKVVPDADAGTVRSASGNSNPAVAATGSVKYTLGVDGFGEANTSLDEFSKPTDWNQDPRTICKMRTDSVASMKEFLERDLAPDSPNRESLRPSVEVQEHFALGGLYAYQGNMERAIEEFQKALKVATSGDPATVPTMEEALGIAYLHKAEMDNDVYRKPGERDLLTTKGLQTFLKTADSEKAVEHFLKFLAQKPGDLEVKWLLNLSYMTLGGYPDKVPPAHLIPPSAFASGEDLGRFIDVAPQSGLTSFGSAGGVIVDDFDNDGLLDVVTSSMDSCAPLQFFHRNADSGFTEQASKAGLSDQLGGLNILQADYNNDGCTDILVLRGGWELAQRKSLLRNNCNGGFTDVTVASGVARPATSTQTAVWTDIDNDGFLDLFVGNENNSAQVSTEIRPNQLFRNKRDGTFEDIAHAAGVDKAAFTKGVTAADYDNDGWTDLYVSNRTGVNFLYHNNHDGTFGEMAKAAGVPGEGMGFATWFFDYDNDGWPDLFLTSYFQSVEESMRTYLGLPNNATTLKLYKNLRDGSFQDVTRQVGLDKVFMPMGSNFGDIDNDGFLDIYLGTGSPSYGSVVPKALLHNKNGESFVDVTTSSGTNELHKGHGVAFADLDNDGDEEIVFEVGGATPGDAHALRLFKNPGHGNDWINLKLVGAKTSRSAIGVRIKVTVENAGGGTRSIHRTVGSGGSFGASPLEQHIGLGKAARIVDVELWWPTSNTRQHFANVDKNQSIEIKESVESYTKLKRPPLQLGGSK